MDTIRVIQDLLLLHRRISVKTQIPISLACNHLKTALAEEIILSGEFQFTRRYRGRLNQNRLKLRGPITIGNRQPCFLLEGELSDRDSETLLDGKMYLTDGNVYQLMSAAIVIVGFLAIVVRWATILIAPIFLGFIYGMTQWHFQHYAREITQLLTDLMMYEKPQS